MKTIFLIPARGGSKGIPGKNVKLLNGKPLLHYSIELARAFTDDANVCVSTDDEAIVKCAAAVNLQVPFLRPTELSTDNAPMDGVVSHAIHYFGNTGIAPDCIILLQPTSPFRQAFNPE